MTMYVLMSWLLFKIHEHTIAFSDESYMGFLKCLCQATSTSMAPNMEERGLKRSLLKVVTACHAEIMGRRS